MPSTASKSLFSTGTPSKTDTCRLAVPLSPIAMKSSYRHQLKIHSPSLSQTHKKRLKHTVTFRSSELSEQLLPVIKSMANGSVTKAVTVLLNFPTVTIRENSIKAVINSVNKECKKFSKRNLDIHLQKSDVSDLAHFNLQKIQEEFQQHSPILWACACQAATGSNKKFNSVKVCAALCTLFQGRSMLLNSLQHVVAISMYNNQLQKEGFSILSKLGFSVTHSTINAVLNKAKSENDKLMKTYKSSLTDHLIRCSLDVDHSYFTVPSKSTEVRNVDHLYAASFPEEPLKDGTPFGYRFNIDNLDFHIKVREMTQEHQNVTRHYTQIMALIDRVSCENLSDDQPVGNLMNVENCEFFPTAEDNYTPRKDMIQVVSKILVEHLPSFNVFKEIYPNHFEHQHSNEMTKKSTVIPLGILLKNENKTNDMIEIMEHLQQYVPGTRSAEELEQIQEREEKNPNMRTIPVGGDQLTCERMRCAHMARLDGDTQEERLEGLMTMVEDFHEKINFLQALMDRFYKAGSAREAGTLCQLRNVINRRNVVKKASADYHAVGSFIDLVTSAHVVTAALKAFGMTSMDDACPKIPHFTEFAEEGSKKRLLDKIIGEIVDRFFLNSLAVTVNRVETDETDMVDPVDDGIYNYATNLTKYGLLRKISVIATRSGDGIRQIRHWKYAFLVYDVAKKIKYRLESFLLLAGVNALFTEKQRYQIMWNRFVNLSGGRDKKLDGDYVMELLNKYAKGRVRMLGPNQTPQVIDRMGKTMMFCHDVNELLEKQISVHPEGTYHTEQDKTRDIKTIVNQLKEANVFSIIRGRHHDSFNENFDTFHDVDIHALHKWLNDKKREYVTSKYAF